MRSSLSRMLLVAGVTFGLLVVAPAPAWSQTKTKTSRKATKSGIETSGPADYSSKYFLIHTDLSPDDARELLKRMDTMIGLIGKYWGRPPSGIIECWVVENERKWPSGTIPQEGLAAILAGAGVTHSTTVSQGNAFIARARVYAVADRGTPLHEAVHAYCAQTFGRTGPVWYAEGMAEMGNYWRDGDISVTASEEIVRYLRGSEPKDLLEIVDLTELTGDSWQNYAWRWALCHLLAYNPNYAPRFRPLGLGMLTGQNVTFESVYGSMAREITFEYHFFIRHLEPGLRVDLCAWDWKAKFKKNKTTSSTVSTIEAGRGWQPSRLTVEPDVEYEFVTSGTWSLSKDGEPVSAAGNDEGGKLVGVVMTDYVLGEPFELGEKGTFTAPAEGDLYLRCEDGWSKLADNKGKITVRVKMKGKGAPLVK